MIENSHFEVICPFETKIEKVRQREKVVLSFVAVLLFLRAQEFVCLFHTAFPAAGTAGILASFPTWTLAPLFYLIWGGQERKNI